MNLRYETVKKEQSGNLKEERAETLNVETRLLPGQTLVGKLELKEYRVSKKEASRAIHHMRSKIASIIFDPYGDDDSEVIVKTLVGTCPYCGESRELDNDRWESCYNFEEDHFEIMPYPILNVLCDLSYSFDRADTDYRTKTCFVKDVNNFPNRIWAVHIGPRNRQFPVYSFGGSNPIALYEFCNCLNPEHLLRKIRNHSNNIEIVTELGDGRLALGSPGPYKGVYPHQCCRRDNKAFYLANPTDHDEESLRSFSLEEHVPERIRTTITKTDRKVSLAIEDVRSSSFRIMEWDLKDGSFIVDGIAIITPCKSADNPDDSASWKERIRALESSTNFLHTFELETFGVKEDLFAWFGEVGIDAKAIQSRAYVDGELLMEDHRSNAYESIIALALANRFRGYPEEFIHSIATFSFGTTRTECQSMGRLPCVFQDLEANIADHLEDVGLPDTELIRRTCLKKPQIIRWFKQIGNFPLKKPSHIEEFLSSENGPYWLEEMATEEYCESKRYEELRVDYQVAKKGEDGAMAYLRQILNDADYAFWWMREDIDPDKLEDKNERK